MSLIDDAEEYNVLGTERDLARLRAMWLKEDRDRVVQELRAYSERLKPGAEREYTQDDLIAEACADLVGALPLDKEAT